MPITLTPEELRDAKAKLLKSIKDAYPIGVKSPRSNEKLRYIHNCLAEIIRNLAQAKLGLETRMEVLAKEKPQKRTKPEEEKIQGEYTEKRMDITIRRKGETGPPLAVIGVKFVLSNYRQNASNYFEGSLGETANIQAKNMMILQILCLPNPVPYKNSDGHHTKNEKIGDAHIDRYRKLMANKDKKQHYVPRTFCIALFGLAIADRGGIMDSEITDWQDLAKLGLSRENLEFLESEGSFQTFLETAIHLVDPNTPKTTGLGG